MDRRNGGDPLAPPRPPKLLPRVHRPRAPEPMAMNDNLITTATSSSSSINGNNQQQQHLLHSINNNININNNNNINSSNINTFSTINSSSSNNNNNNNNHTISIIPTSAHSNDFDDDPIHHLTFLPQHPSSLSRNSSNASSSTAANSSSGASSATSFTRRRPPPPTPGSAVPLLSIGGSSSSSSSTSTSHSNNNNNFLSHFQRVDPVPPPPASPVTLAQPRPESERLTNEYVDTPLRTAHGQQLQLQHATRSQHPAGQQDNGQTTTHHLLLLPQRELMRQHHQIHSSAHQHPHTHPHQHQQHLQHTTRLASAAGSANAQTAATAAAAAATSTAAGIDGIDGLLHSHHTHHNHQQHSQQTNGNQKTPASTTTTTGAPGLRPTAEAKFTPSPPPRIGGTGFAAAANAQPITQPITKQPTSAAASDGQKLSGKERIHALEELLERHGAQQVNPVTGQLGASIVIGGDPSLLSPIVCPRCGRCRCEQCQSPRPLPQTWVCNKTCLCSAESIIDYGSCLCCAKALFYHCACDNDMDCDDGNGTPCVDNPCSCGPYKRTQRWGWLGALSIVLPCLWLYWPMRGCMKLCEKCYARVAGRGCRCQGIGSTSSMLPIVPLGVSSLGNGSGNGAQMGNAGTQSNGKAVEHGRSECSAASRILRKGDLTPEKRLLDSSQDY